MIESNAKTVVKEGFNSYVRNHKAAVEKTKSEFVFIMKLLEELNTLHKF